MTSNDYQQAFLTYINEHRVNIYHANTYIPSVGYYANFDYKVNQSRGFR